MHSIYTKRNCQEKRPHIRRCLVDTSIVFILHTKDFCIDSELKSLIWLLLNWVSLYVLYVIFYSGSITAIDSSIQMNVCWLYARREHVGRNWSGLWPLLGLGDMKIFLKKFRLKIRNLFFIDIYHWNWCFVGAFTYDTYYS